MTPPDGRSTDPRLEPLPRSSWRWSGAFRTLTAFQPDEVVAGRFRIVRFIASGGMGEVYEAYDQELQDRVALKTMRPEIAEEERVLERFRREIQLARRVTHPSVCRSFDIFRHRLSPPPGWEGPTPEVTLLSMELLEGETLAERIKRGGPLTTDEALPIVEQVAAALGAAHDAGVVHRDFKTSNVILVPGKKGIRAVVTDFGLARSGSASSGSLTSSSGLAGSPAYMAPEQVGGGEITPATDVYSLGVVMFEMVTGRWPFEGDTPLALAVKRLNEPPPSPRSIVPSLDPRWERTILRCLERDPADRFEGTEDVIKALAGGEVKLPPGRRRRAARWIAAGAAVLLAFGAGVLLRPRASSTPASAPASAPVPSRRAVAVLDFKNLAGRPDVAWLAKALPEMLSMELMGVEKVRVIPGENVARMKVELSLPDTDSLARDTLTRIRASLGSDLVVLGSYFAAGKEAGGQLRLDLRVQDANAGETVASVSETGTEAAFLALVSRAGAQLRSKLGGETASTPHAGAGSLPSVVEAARLYSEGLARLRLFDAPAARELLERAVAADPKYPLTHSALAEAWAVLGYDVKAREEAKRAFDLAGSLPREEALLVEGRYREAARQWEKAVDVWRTLWGFFPDNLEYGLRLAEAQASFGQGKDALATLETLRRLPAPVSSDPRIDLAEARAAESVGDFRRALAAAAKAVDQGKTQGARLLLARARLMEARAHYRLGDGTKAVAASEEARRFYEEAGDRAGVARALVEMATAVYFQGDLIEAQRRADESLVIARAAGDRTGVTLALNVLANVANYQGRPDDGLKLHEETLRLAREIGNKEREATALNNVARDLWAQGKLPAALRHLDACRALSTETGDQSTLPYCTFNTGEVLHDQGDLAGARKAYGEALEVSRRIGARRVVGVALSGLGKVALAEGDLAESRRRHAEALASRREGSEKGYVAESQLALAVVSLEEGKPENAEAPAREALAEFQREKAVHSEALAQAVLAEVLLASGKKSEALQMARRGQALAEKTGFRALRLEVALRAARVELATTEVGPAVKRLTSALADAKAHGLEGLALEARLLLAEADVRFGDPLAGRAALAKLAREAAARGFHRVKRLASAAASAR